MKTFRDLKVGDICWECCYLYNPIPIILKEIKIYNEYTKFSFNNFSIFLENDDLDETHIYDDNEDTFIYSCKEGIIELYQCRIKDFEKFIKTVEDYEKDS